jgi:hypothetical protein
MICLRRVNSRYKHLQLEERKYILILAIYYKKHENNYTVSHRQLQERYRYHL